MNRPQLHVEQHSCKKAFFFLKQAAFQMSFLILKREQHLYSTSPEYLVPLSTGGGEHYFKVLQTMVIKCTLILKPMNNKWLRWENLMGRK